MAQITLNSTGVASDGALVLQSNGTTAAVTIDTSQRAAFVAGTAALPAITTTGDTNTGIFFPAADTLAFSEGGVEAMRIDSSGNVGINVTPSAWGATYKGLQIGYSGFFGSRTAANQVNISNNYVTNGITDNYINTGFAQLYQQDTAGKHNWFNAASGTAGGSLTFTQAMTLDASGNLGIGTASPSVPFDVQANSSAQGIRVRGRASGDSSSVSFYSNNNATEQFSIFSSSSENAFFGTGSRPMTFSTNSAERMRIDSSGNLLVGTTSAVQGSRLNTTRADTTGGTTIANFFNSACTSTTRNANVLLRIASNASSADACINFTDNTTHNYYFGGNNGGAYVVANTNGVRLANGGTSWASDSDERVKDIIEPITDAANKVSTLRAVIGKYKTDEEGIRRSFLIAQDVQAVLPEAVVAQPDEIGTLSLAYTDVIPLLVAAIKEQQALITTLTDRITALEQA
jgi:hypothetical protein